MVKPNRKFLGALSLLFMAATVHASHTSAALVLPVEAAVAGETVHAAIRLRSEPHWHTYWKNPGDAGKATTVKWTLPEGVSGGSLQWPVPLRLEEAGLISFVFENEVLLPVDIELASDLNPGPVELKAHVSWLECSESCIPGDANLSASLTIGTDTKPSADAAAIEAARSRLPRNASGMEIKAAWDGAGSGDSRAVLIEWPVRGSATDADFFPDAYDDYEVGLTPELLPVKEGWNQLRLQVSKWVDEWPSTISGVLVIGSGEAKQAFSVQLDFTNPTPAAGERDVQAQSSSPASVPPSQADSSIVWSTLLVQLGLALIGGLLLNLMPCVLPILSLKVLHLVQQHDSTGSQARKHALVYALGVLVSFWCMAGLVLAGRLASWGEQFQDPRFVVVMTALMTLVTLNLFGLFEFILPGATVSKASELTGREGLGGAFFTGAFSVVLGASCVAPVLAAAIGWAISQPPVIIVSCFSMIGLGLALPFTLLSFFPSLRRWLPKPGAWMEKFKIAMGFPMLATVAWLLAQTGDHFGVKGPLWVGVFLVLFALAVWIYGEFHQRGTKRRTLAAVISFAILIGAYAWTLESELHWRTPPAAGTQTQNAATMADDGIPWQPWSQAAVDAAQAAGHPVLVDFTANWCLTCQINKKTSLEIEAVRAKIKDLGFIALLADYTRKDAEITAELKRFQRAGVPLVLVYPKDASAPPELLPTVLTPSIVLDALEGASQPN